MENIEEMYPNECEAWLNLSIHVLCTFFRCFNKGERERGKKHEQIITQPSSSETIKARRCELVSYFWLPFLVSMAMQTAG